jgi:hypothetical protein
MGGEGESCLGRGARWEAESGGRMPRYCLGRFQLQEAAPVVASLAVRFGFTDAAQGQEGRALPENYGAVQRGEL